MPVLDFLYKTVPGRILLRPLVSKPVSDISGKLMDTRASGVLIRPFARKNDIKCEDYLLDGIKTFNEFFCRRIRSGLRPFDMGKASLVAPCDGLLTAYDIEKGTVIPVKQSTFSIRSLLRDSRLAESFEGGKALVFRLCVNHYHRYSFFDSGRCYKNRRIRGIYHTVRPVALEEYRVFTENAREYVVIDTGAMLVGKIGNEKYDNSKVMRGDEKGHFESGGSTIIVLLRKNHALIREEILRKPSAGEETPVRMGEIIGVKDGNG